MRHGYYQFLVLIWCHVVAAPDPAAVARVDIVLVNNTVTCQSRGIYPIPQLTWSVSPRPATVLQNTTEVHEDDQGLYDISGFLTTVYSDTESTYSCSVQNEHSGRKATLRLRCKSLKIRQTVSSKALIRTVAIQLRVVSISGETTTSQLANIRVLLHIFIEKICLSATSIHFPLKSRTIDIMGLGYAFSIGQIRIKVVMV